ncbi:MAG: phasin family protein [Pseudomonadota bacterium]
MADTSMIDPEQLAAEAQKTVEKMTKSMEGAASFGQQNMDAMVEASRIATKAMEGLSAEMMAFSKKSYEETVAAAKDFAQVKSLPELVEKQTAFGQASVESMMGELAKVGEMMSEAMKDATAPLTARMTASVDYAKSITA